MKFVHALMACTALLIGAVSAAGPASAAPTVAASSVTVVPSTGLAGGDTVGVTASGLTPSAAVRVIECDIFVGDPDYDCPDRTTTTADSAGNVSVDITLVDPVYRAEPFGDPTPVYCRADICRMFLVWNDGAGVQQVLASDTLEFTGSPATIAASPATNLRKKQRVLVAGTAYGAEGHTVRILEEACFSIVQGSGCYGALPTASTTVRPDGTFDVYYRARRFLADGTDCTGDILGFCELNAVVLDTNGNPDDSFGVSRRGQPAAPLTFRTG
jgi:hypothetical protein